MPCLTTPDSRERESWGVDSSAEPGQSSKDAKCTVHDRSVYRHGHKQPDRNDTKD